VPFDLRKTQPYWAYDRIPFDIALGKNGDNFDRYLVRMAEMEQSMRIAEQALDGLPGGAIQVDWEGKAIDPAAYVDMASRARPRASCCCPSSSRPTCRARIRGPRSRQRAGQAGGPADEGGGLRLDRGTDEPLHAGHGGLRDPPARGRGVLCGGGANGELGFYVVSDGAIVRTRALRPPCMNPVAAIRP